jgi:TolB-like protein/Flp pilus assembly protein TadD
MKRCPQCNRLEDDSLIFCRVDGSPLAETSNELETSLLPQALTDPGRARSTGPTTALPLSDAPPRTRELKDVSSPRRNVASTRNSLIAGAIGILVVTALGVGSYLKYGRSNKQISSIAVMPFVNASGNKDIEYLSDGLTDSLIFRISQLPNLKVSPTSSVMRFKSTPKDLAEVARELDVDGVLTGRVMLVADNLSISVQLIDARTQKLVWAEQYDRKMADLLATQREIATTLTQKMQLGLAGDERGITKKYTSSNEAYQLYLRGRYHWSRRSKDDLHKAIDNYKKAIDIDPNFALAYAATAEAYNSMGKNPDAAPKDTIPLAKAAAARALEIDPMLPQAHSALADSLAIYDWNWVEAERHFKKALELDPNISYIHLVYSASYLCAVGRMDEALSEAKKAVQLEPLSLINNSVAVTAYLNSRHYEEALAQARTAFDLDPTFPIARHWLAFALIANGKYDEAISLSQQVSSDTYTSWLSMVVLAHAYAKQGKRSEAEHQISSLRDLGKTNYIRSYYIASIYAALGDKDKAFAELERSFEERDCYLGRISVDPFMDPLRDDPRFKNLTKRMNLSQ